MNFRSNRTLGRLAAVAVLAATTAAPVLTSAPRAGASQATVAFECTGINYTGTIKAQGVANWSFADGGFAIDSIDYTIQVLDANGAPKKMGNKSNIDVSYFDTAGGISAYNSPDSLRPSGRLANRDGSPLFVTTSSIVPSVSVTADVRWAVDPSCTAYYVGAY